MQKRKTAFIQQMEAAGVCDSRGMAIVVTAAQLPGGEEGLCLLGLQGNVLSVYDTDMTARVGEKRYSLLLCTVTEMKTSDNSFMEQLRGYSLRLVTGNAVYAFRNCYQHKGALAVIRSEVR